MKKTKIILLLSLGVFTLKAQTTVIDFETFTLSLILPILAQRMFLFKITMFHFSISGILPISIGVEGFLIQISMIQQRLALEIYTG